MQLSDEFFPVSEQIKPMAAPQPRPLQPHSPEPIKAKMEIPILPPLRQPEPIQAKREVPIPPPPPPIVKKESYSEKTNSHSDYIRDDDDDDDNARRSHRKTLPFSVIGITIAVVFSVVVSAVVAMMIASNTNKDISSGLGELEKKVSETNVKQDQKIDALSQKVKSIAEKPLIPQMQGKPAVPSHAAIKPIAMKSAKQVVKHRPAPRKKKGKSSAESVVPSSSEETSSSALTPSAQEASPSTESAPSASEPSTPPPAPEPEASPPPSSPEGSN